MIRLATPQDEARLLAIARRAPCIGPRAEVDWRILQSNPAMPYRFYLQDDAAVLELTGGGAVLCGTVADGEELAAFLHSLGVGGLLSGGWRPPGWLALEYLVMEKTAPALGVYPLPPGFEEAPPVADVLAVLESSEGRIQPEAAREGYYADVCARRSRGLALVCGLREKNGRLAGTAGVYALTEREAYIACVETLPAARGRGYARALVQHLCGRFAGRALTLMCEEWMQGFYRTLGFAPQGSWVVKSAPR